MCGVFSLKIKKVKPEEMCLRYRFRSRQRATATAKTMVVLLSTSRRWLAHRRGKQTADIRVPKLPSEDARRSGLRRKMATKKSAPGPKDTARIAQPLYPTGTVRVVVEEQAERKILQEKHASLAASSRSRTPHKAPASPASPSRRAINETLTQAQQRACVA